MPKVHFSPRLNRLARCQGTCKFGESTPHFDSMAEGEAWVAAQAEAEHGVVPKAQRKKTASSRDITPLPDRERLRLNDSWLNYVTKENQYQVERTYRDEQLSFVVTEHSGELVDKNVFAARSFEGKPDWSKLDAESYRAFGFSERTNDDHPYVVPKGQDTDDQTMKGLWMEKFIRAKMKNCGASISASESELENLPSGHGSPRHTLGRWTEDEDMYRDIQSFVRGETVREVKPAHVEAVEHIDSSIRDHSPQEQRLLYRGCSFKESGLDESTLKLGVEVKFDGYQATSSEPIVARSYLDSVTSGKRMIMEISSPAGLSLSYVSDFEDEQEVLLPRGSRYVVVGIHSITQEKKQPVKGTNKWYSVPEHFTVVQMVAVNSNGELLDGTNADPLPELL